MPANTSSIAVQVREQFPEYIRSEESRLVTLLECYYEFLERAGPEDRRPLAEFGEFLRNARIDSANTEFVEVLLGELGEGLPRETRLDRRLLAKQVGSVFDTAGTEDGIVLAFRAYHDETATVRRPGEFVLKPSDGDWVKRDSIAIVGTVSESVEGHRVHGSVSGASADAQEVSHEERLGEDISIIVVTNVSGEFENDETISVSANDTPIGVLYAASGPLSAVMLTDGGAEYSVGDALSIVATLGQDATGIVREIGLSDRVRFFFDSDRYNYGYRFDQTAQDAGDYTGIIDVSVSGGRATTDAGFRVSSVTDAEEVTINDEVIGVVADVTLGSSPFGTPTPRPGFSGPSSALSSADLNDPIGPSLREFTVSVGRIDGITVTGSGDGYEFLPAISIRDEVVFSHPAFANTVEARVEPILDPGSITRLEILRPGAGYSQGEGLAIINETRDVGRDASGTAVVDAFFRDRGRYEGRSGWISDEDKLHDGDYYQDSSYVISSFLDEKKFRTDIEPVFHPSGTKMFTETITRANARLGSITTPFQAIQIVRPSSISFRAGNPATSIT